MWLTLPCPSILFSSTGFVAEAHAALTAVQWQLGQAAKAEEHFAIATAIDSRWKRTSYIQSQTRWPPKLYLAMEKFLSIVPG